MLTGRHLRGMSTGARFEGRALGGIQLERLRQAFDGVRVWEAPHSALEISDTTCAEPRPLCQGRLRQTGALPKLSKKLCKRPPTLIVHSEDDRTFVPGSKLYDAALTEMKVPHEFLLYQTGGHGYGLRCEREAKAWPEAAIKWLRAMKVISD